MAKSYVGDLDSLSSLFEENPWVMVAAIDFGTTYTGYGFSFKNEPENVKANKNWGSELGTSSFKTPTSVLVDENRQFVAFGYQAEHMYSQFCITGKADEYDLYRHFKMMLYHERDLNRRTYLKSTRGNICEALKIFAMALKYMKNHLLEAVAKQVDSQPSTSLIKWVITVPAIWNDKAKQFMREAAFEAGLVNAKDSKQLLFALEPEAASVLCRSLAVHQFRESAMNVQFESGTKYMVIDAGGGTIDIAAHEVLEDGNMKEIACGSGGDWGGSQVDSNFIQLMSKILGKQFMDSFKKNCPSDWLALMTDFEIKKKATNLDSATGIMLQLSWAMAKKYTEVTGWEIHHTIQETSSEGVSFSSGNIVFSPEVVMELFNPVIDNIIDHIQEHLDETPRLKDITYFLLVGGFSESNILYERLQKAFASIAPVISPHSAGLAIIKGAVMFGHNPKAIIERVSRKTYGTAVSTPFDQEKHKLKYKYWHKEEEEFYCSDVFQTYIAKGEGLRVDRAKTFSISPIYKTETSVHIGIFTSDKTDITHSNDEGVEKIGSMTIYVPLSAKYRNLETKVYFGLTEFKVTCTDKSRTDGQTVHCTIDFLTDKVNSEEKFS